MIDLSSLTTHSVDVWIQSDWQHSDKMYLQFHQQIKTGLKCQGGTGGEEIQ